MTFDAKDRWLRRGLLTIALAASWFAGAFFVEWQVKIGHSPKTATVPVWSYIFSEVVLISQAFFLTIVGTRSRTKGEVG